MAETWPHRIGANIFSGLRTVQLKILKILDTCYVLRLDEARSATVAVDTRRSPATFKIRLTGRNFLKIVLVRVPLPTA